MAARLVLALMLVTLLAGCSGGNNSQPSATGTTAPADSPTPTATPEPKEEPSPSPTPAARLDAIRLTVGEPKPLPADLVVYAFDGVWEGPTTAFRRYYRDSTGTFQSDDLLVSTFAGPKSDETRGIVGVLSAPPGVLAAGICHGYCYGSPEPVTAIRSEDGGVTWHELGTVELGSWGTVAGIVDEGLLVRGAVAGDWRNSLEVWTASGHQPVGFPPHVDNEAPVFAIRDGGQTVLAGVDRDRARIWRFDNVAEPYAVVPPSARTNDPWSIRVIDHFGEPQLHVDWSGTPGQSGYFGVLRPGAGEFDRVYRWDTADGISGAWVMAWVSETVAIGRANLPVRDYGDESVPPDYHKGVPVLIDMVSGVVTPISDFFPMLRNKGGGPVVVGLRVGPFLRVNAGEGDCLNVREAPSLESPVLVCLPHNVIVGASGEEAEAEGVPWRAVTTPDGREGWAAAEFLQ